jgi:O-antigen/teichoic acid export membrane protein
MSREIRASKASGTTETIAGPDVGLRVVRTGTARGIGYGANVLLTAASSVILLRYLGVADFGRFMTVMSVMAIVGGVTDAGLTTIATREMALLAAGAERRALLADLLGLRLILAVVGVAAALAFTVLAGYSRQLVFGAAIVGAGVVLTAWQATIALPLVVELRAVKLVTLDLVRQAATLVGIAALAAAGASLFPFFVVPAAAAVGTLFAATLLVRRGTSYLPAVRPRSWRMLIRESLPAAASLVMNIIYFRVLIVLMSIIATAVATGLFATSFRVFELLFGLSAVAVTVALPVLSVAAEDRQRLRYMLQRMIEVSTMAACYFVVVVVIAARPVLVLLGGAQYAAAAPVARIQIFALIPVFIGQACQAALISVRRQKAQAAANAFALVVVIAAGAALVPSFGARGGAVAAVVAECVLTSALLVVLRRAEPLLRIDFGFAWKVALAAGLAATPLLVPRLPAIGAAIAATCIYALTLALTRAVPPEVVDALNVRRMR